MAKSGSATRRLLKILGIGLSLTVIFGIFANAMGWMERGEPVRTVESDRAEIRTITQTVSASGKIQPETEVIIRPDVSGEEIVTGSYRVLSRELQDGDQVEIRNQQRLMASN